MSKTVMTPEFSMALLALKELYNGNIAAMTVTFNHYNFVEAGTGLI